MKLSVVISLFVTAALAVPLGMTPNYNFKVYIYNDQCKMTSNSMVCQSDAVLAGSVRFSMLCDLLWILSKSGEASMKSTWTRCWRSIFILVHPVIRSMPPSDARTLKEKNMPWMTT
jgi:hypothetical protein